MPFVTTVQVMFVVDCISLNLSSGKLLQGISLPSEVLMQLPYAVAYVVLYLCQKHISILNQDVVRDVEIQIGIYGIRCGV